MDYVLQPFRWLAEKATLARATVRQRTVQRTRIPAQQMAQRALDEINPQFRDVLLTTPFYVIDHRRQGYIDIDDFREYFSQVGGYLEIRQMFDLINIDGSGTITLGQWQSFMHLHQSEDDDEDRKPGKIGCPDFLEYAAMLLGVKRSCDRQDLLDVLRAAGEPFPPSDEWLEAAMQREWAAHPRFAVHWAYVIGECPVDEAGRRFPDWNGGFSVRDTGHEGFTVDDFCNHPLAKEADLRRPDVLGLRLCTGPGYEALNASLRANSTRFPVTQFCIDRAVGRLAQRCAPDRPRTSVRGLR
jgi:hypothetical protein